MEFKNEDVIDINILFALTKCLSEVSHNLQYVLLHMEKKKLKNSIQSIKTFEKEVNKRFQGQQKEAVESVYDVLMDLILEAREISLKNTTNLNK
jgi:hypothetical protein